MAKPRNFQSIYSPRKRFHMFDSRPYMNVVGEIIRAKFCVFGDTACRRRMSSYNLNVHNLWKLGIYRCIFLRSFRRSHTSDFLHSVLHSLAKAILFKFVMIPSSPPAPLAQKWSVFELLWRQRSHVLHLSDGLAVPLFSCFVFLPHICSWSHWYVPGKRTGCPFCLNSLLSDSLSFILKPSPPRKQSPSYTGKLLPLGRLGRMRGKKKEGREALGEEGERNKGLRSLESNTWEWLTGLFIEFSLFYWSHKTNCDDN